VDEQGVVESLVLDEPSVKGVIFDFDGVIVRLRTDYDALRKKLAEYSLNRFRLSMDFKPLSTGLARLGTTLGPEALAGAYGIVEEFELSVLSKLAVNARLIKAIKQSNRRKKLAIFSMNMHKTIETLLQREKILDYFDLIIAREDVSRFKPDPEGIETILAVLQIGRNEVVYVGDRAVDEETGNRAGIRTLIIKQVHFT
jgi:phosphoglycolate phosphatase-like HAD superfamily hydrolase